MDAIVRLLQKEQKLGTCTQIKKKGSSIVAAGWLSKIDLLPPTHTLVCRVVLARWEEIGRHGARSGIPIPSLICGGQQTSWVIMIGTERDR